MPAQAQIDFTDNNPAGANNEDGFIVIRAASEDPWTGSGTGGSIKSVATFLHDSKAPSTALANSYTDTTLQPNIEYYYRVVYYRATNKATKDWANKTEYNAGSTPVGPVLVPDADTLGYPNNVPSNTSGVNYSIGTEPIVHISADSIARQAGWPGPGNGNLWDQIRTFNAYDVLKNEASTYGSGPGIISQKQTHYQDRQQSVYLWRGLDNTLDPIPLIGDRYVVGMDYPSRYATHGVERASWAVHKPAVNSSPSPVSIIWDEGVTVAGVTTGSNAISHPYVHPTTGVTNHYLSDRNFGLHNSEAIYNHGSMGWNSWSLDGTMMNWSDQSIVAAGHYINSGMYTNQGTDDRAWGSGTFAGSMNRVSMDYGGFMKAAEIRGPTYTDYGLIGSPVGDIITSSATTHSGGPGPTITDTHLDRPMNLSIQIGVMQADGRQRCWMDGGVDTTSGGSPFVNATPTVYQNDNGANVTVPPNSTIDEGFRFYGDLHCVAEFLFIPKALSSVEFSDLIGYFQNKYAGYLRTQGLYSDKFA